MWSTCSAWAPQIWQRLVSQQQHHRQPTGALRRCEAHAVQRLEPHRGLLSARGETGDRAGDALELTDRGELAAVADGPGEDALRVGVDRVQETAVA